MPDRGLVSLVLVTLALAPLTASGGPPGMVRAAEAIGGSIDLPLPGPSPPAPDDPYWGEQWGPRASNFPAAWLTTRGSSIFTVAVLDSGIGSHPDLQDAVCQRGSDLTGGNWMDLDPHGTKVAGILAARSGNAIGISGLADACLIDIRILDSQGFGTWAHVLEGIDEARAFHARIVLMSIAGTGAPPAVEAAIHQGVEEGMLFIAAAGNAPCSVSDPGTVQQPASFHDVVAVAAARRFGSDAITMPWEGSSCGPEVDLVAPGVSIMTTEVEGYGLATGTSFAAPFVAGAALLVWTKHPDWTPLRVRCALEKSAHPIVATPGSWGDGLLDAAGALATDGKSC